MKVILRRPTDEDFVPSFYSTFNCGQTNVVDTLTVDEIRYWEPQNPILIQAPPGRGKTTFIISTVIPYAMAKGKNVLFLSSRVAISTQTKRKALQTMKSPLEKQLTDDGILATEVFENFAVIHYNRLSGFLNDPAHKDWLSKVGFLICDEAHSLATEASFNTFCDWNLHLITSRFCNAIRVYMSATPEDIMKPLADAETENYHNYRASFFGPRSFEPRSFMRYLFQPDYHRVQIRFFDEIKELKREIENFPNEKFLIFTYSKDLGHDLVRDLGENRADYLDADSKGTELWKTIIREEKFQKQILVTTTVLAEGANINDPALKHVVVFSDDRTELIQAMGRKRFPHGQTPALVLHVCNLSPSSLHRRYQNARELHQELEDYEAETSHHNRAVRYWTGDDCYRHYFRLGEKGLYPNQLAFFKLSRQLAFYEKLIDGKETFPQAVYRWLGQKSVAEGDIPQVLQSSNSRLEAYYADHTGVVLTEDDMNALRELVTRAAEEKGFTEPRHDRILGIAAINNRLEKLKLPCRLKKCGNEIKLI